MCGNVCMWVHTGHLFCSYVWLRLMFFKKYINSVFNTSLPALLTSPTLLWAPYIVPLLSPQWYLLMSDTHLFPWHLSSSLMPVLQGERLEQGRMVELNYAQSTVRKKEEREKGWWIKRQKGRELLRNFSHRPYFTLFCPSIDS